jgi:protein-tyrosine phosphatase
MLSGVSSAGETPVIDLHCHILHDIDDGPADLAESVELCRIAQSNNIERIVATPHFAMAESIDGFIETRAARLAELKTALAQNAVKVELFAGAEVFVTEALLSAGCLNLLTINGSRYILIEFPYTGLRLPELNHYMAIIQSCGLIPIIAHPERYAFFQHDDEMLNTLLAGSALLQVNAGSLCRPGYKAVSSLANEIVRCKAASFLATDAHSVSSRPNHLLDMLNAMPTDIEFDYLDALVNSNPKNVLQDKTVDAGVGRRLHCRRNS